MNCWFHHNVTWSNLKDSLPPAPQPVVEEIHPIKIQKAISVDSSEGSGRYSVDIYYNLYTHLSSNFFMPVFIYFFFMFNLYKKTDII